ncbi:MAG TPA: rod shape-determining protein MreC [Firmicutes bacterium]|nr:rod shape-determining protein MreC [Bacillota bacterium]
MPELAKNRKYLALAVATVLLTLLMSLAAREGSRVGAAEGLLHEALAPVQGLVYTVSNRVSGAVRFVAEIRRLGAENAELKKELAQLKARENVAREVWSENVRLRKLLALPPGQPELTTVGARVVARDPGNWYKTLTIDRGTRDGLKVDMVVLGAGGVAGRITRVAPHTAEVLLLSDQRSAIGAMGQLSRDVGVLKGGETAQDGCRLVYLPRSATLQPGELVVTSGLGGLFPKGLVLGQVIEVKSEGYGLGKYARVTPAVDLDHLEEVLVITDVRG